MIPTATVVFREFIEIALILGVVMAATRGLSGRVAMVSGGLAIGILGSIIIAFFTDAISEAVDGTGQEIFNATIMFMAVLFLSWTVLWMRKHGKEMAHNMRRVGQEVVAGKRSSNVLVVIVALATFREGAEIVMFTYSMVLSGQFDLSSVVAGGVLGAMGGSLVGICLYFGLLKAAQKHLFLITSWMLIILTAGMAAKGASYLVAVDILPAIQAQMWDSSSFISGGSALGELLSVLVGYTPRPTAMELIFYVIVLAVLGTLYHSIGRKQALSTLDPKNA